MPLTPAQLSGRYITLNDLNPFLELYKKHKDIEVQNLGFSVLKREIPVIRIGHGPYKILCWSQMHGNESTTTKMLLDICHDFFLAKEDDLLWASVAKAVSLVIVPMLNPDGSNAYTRENANKVDLNRDALSLMQPESTILRDLFNKEKPNLCLNLHGQRSIYGIKMTGESAAISFLAPAADTEKSVTPARLHAMHLICGLNRLLQKHIPGQVGRYDDSFNASCVGDTFTSLGCPTILFEAGQLGLDYMRNNTRKLLKEAFMSLLLHLSGDKPFANSTIDEYNQIPANQVLYNDLLVKSVKLPASNQKVNISAQYKEVLHNDKIEFIPELVAFGKDVTGFAHQTIDAQKIQIDYSTIKSTDLAGFIKEYLLKNFSR